MLMYPWTYYPQQHRQVYLKVIANLYLHALAIYSEAEYT